MTSDSDDVEVLLARYQPPGPPAALRGALIAHAARLTWFTTFQSIAAALLLATNLTVIAFSIDHARPAPDPAHRKEIAAELAVLRLPLSPEETDQLANQLAAADHQTLAPEIHGHLDSLSLPGVPR